MKNILLSASIMLFGLINAQNTEFKFTSEGLTDFIVVETPGKSSSELYNKSLEWINKTFNTPKEVIKSEVTDDYIRIQGSQNNIVCRNSIGMKYCGDANYQIEISFKDGKYKFDVIALNLTFPELHYTKENLMNFDKNVYFKNDGSPRAIFRDYPLSLPKYFNDLNNSLLSFIDGTGLKANKDNW